MTEKKVSWRKRMIEMDRLKKSKVSYEPLVPRKGDAMSTLEMLASTGSIKIKKRY